MRGIKDSSLIRFYNSQLQLFNKRSHISLCTWLYKLKKLAHPFTADGTEIRPILLQAANSFEGVGGLDAFRFSR